MGVLKVIFGVLFILIVIALLLLYWFIPFEDIEFNTVQKNSNFSLNTEGMESMQFYPNMRFPESKISYRIDDNCILKKQNAMERTFEIMENLTVLDFYPVQQDEEIYITCEETITIGRGGLFIAGEGGPTKVIKAEKFYIILEGQILLLRSISCPNPNVEIHELLHVLGFEHSTNENNIMYNFTNLGCTQTIGDDIPELLNKLYSVPSYADLKITNISAEINGRYLNVEISIRNDGLRDSEPAELYIYADDKLIKKYDIKAIKFGEGRKITFENILITKVNIDELNFVVETSFEELEKENNKITLEIKNQ